MKKKLTSMLLLATVLMNGFVTYGQVWQGNENEASLNFQNQTVSLNKDTKREKVMPLEEAPVLKEGQVWLPIRFVAEHLLGAIVTWDESNEIIRIRRGTEVFILKSGVCQVNIDEREVSVEEAPFVKNNVLMVSATSLKALFEVEVSVNEQTGEILVKGQDLRPNEAPVARFELNEKQYTEGQTVTVINMSKDPDQDEIIDHLWSVNGEETQDIKTIFSKPKAGNYTVGLKVQDERGLWSEWTYEEVVIKENEPPKILSLKPSKESFAQGEAIELAYSYDNETWEAITTERWTYRKSDEATNTAVSEKPEAFFTAGDYVVTLQIDDASGKRSQVVETTVHITDEVESYELEYHFTKGEIGARIDNFGGFNFRSYDDAEVTSVEEVPGTLMMSDSPETVRQKGVLYESMINGKGRLLLHHLNSLTEEATKGEKQRLAVIAENQGDKPAVLKVSNTSVQGPATDIMRIGQKVLFEYLNGNEETTITIAPGEKVALYEKNWTYGGCISGLLDFETDDNLNLMVAALGENDFIDEAERLPKDGVHISGNFNAIGLKYELNLDGSKPTKFLLGAGGSDEWVDGSDVRTGEVVENKGNFGVSYYVTLTAEEDMGILINSRGGAYKGAIKWVGESTYNVPGNGVFGNTTTKAAMMGLIHKGETKTFEYMLPNGSAAPILIGFVPKSQWNQ